MVKYTAETADKYKLYIEAVQCVEADIDFVYDIYKKKVGKKPKSLKEDFSGSFAAAVEFITRSKKNTALAVDLDSEVLEWGKAHNLKRIAGSEERLTILNENVLDVSEPKVDVVLAMNFSYFLFVERESLKAYFKNAYKSLKKNGLFFLDAYGGTESIDVCEEEKECNGFTYVWNQYKFNPITSRALNYIHFRFPDGTMLDKAFEYEWRLWTLAEIQDILREVGFCDIGIYWEGWDEEEEAGDGVFTLTEEAENCPGWVCYIVAGK